MKKLILITSLFLIIAQGFAQADSTEGAQTDSIEVAQTKAKGILKQLFMFQMAIDVLETRQLMSDNELGDSVENYMFYYDNALFFKSTLDYKFFWNTVLGRKNHKVPSKQLFLDSKEEYLSENKVGSSIDLDIVLTPNWEDSVKEESLINYSVKITPSNYTKLYFTEDQEDSFNTVLNSPFATNVASPKDAEVNEAVFNGLAVLRKKVKRRDIRPSAVVFDVYNNSDFYKFDKNEEEKCKYYPTYKDKNDLDDGSRWIYIFENTPTILKATVSPINTASKFVLKSDITTTIQNVTSNSAQINIETTNSLNYFVVAKDTVGEDKTLGGLNVISQSSVEEEFVVKIYRLKGPSEANYPNVNTATITNKLMAIYSVCGKIFNVSSITHDLASNLDINNNGYFENYDDERKLLNQTMNSLSANGEISVFILNDKIKSKDKDGNIVEATGFAPNNNEYPDFIDKPYVVLTCQNTTIDETLAHEIGHCVFGLKHPFDEFASQVRYQDPNNIMDYRRAYGFCWLRAYQILKINQFNNLRLCTDK